MEQRKAYRIVVRKSKKRQPLEDLGVETAVILKAKIKEDGGSEETGCIWLRIGASGELL
jgi:hypothetical protein